MPTRNTRLLLLAGCILAAAALAFVGSKPESRDVGSSNELPKKSTNNQFGTHNKARKIRDTATRTSESKTEDFLEKWDLLGNSLQGNQLILERTNLINEARKRLRGEDLARLLDAAIQGGSFESYETVLISASFVLFADANEDQQNRLASIWLSKIDNKAAREKLAYTFGLSYKGTNVGEAMDYFDDVNTKQTILNGYCSNLASNGSPCSAFSIYQNNLPKNGDYSGVAIIAANMRTEFPEFLAMLPSDERTLVSKAREQTLRSWARQNPLDAANFVQDNSNGIKPDYLKSVVSTWMESDPNAAIDWARKQNDSANRVNSFRGIVDFWKGSEPERAWDLILNESGIDSYKDELLKKIHADWIKTDPKAAESARSRYQILLQSR